MSFCLFLASLLCLFVQISHADTEIVNFVAVSETADAVSGTSQWPTLGPSLNERTFRIQPRSLNMSLDTVCPNSRSFECPHQVWIVLDLDHPTWAAYSSFTLRISWPASSPTNFGIDLFSPKALSMFNVSTGPLRTPGGLTETSSTRRKYARIRLMDIGVRAPTSRLYDDYVAFNLILEPLFYGFLPTSVVPVILCLVPIIVCATLMLAPINRFLGKIAAQAREEIRVQKFE